jgi:hypothetical protein
VRANGRPVDPKLWRLSASSSTPYRINLGNEWVEVPPPELFDLWDNAGNLPGEAARQQPR